MCKPAAPCKRPVAPIPEFVIISRLRELLDNSRIAFPNVADGPAAVGYLRALRRNADADLLESGLQTVSQGREPTADFVILVRSLRESLEPTAPPASSPASLDLPSACWILLEELETWWIEEYGPAPVFTSQLTSFSVDAQVVCQSEGLINVEFYDGKTVVRLTDPGRRALAWHRLQSQDGTAVSSKREPKAVDHGDHGQPHDAGDVAHGVDFRCVRWFGAEHTFTGTQAACVKILWEHWEQGTPAVGEQTILEAADSSSGQLRDVFDKGSHSAWGTMIVEARKGAFRLQTPAESGGMA
jgi:hypothetical protein